MLENSEPQTEPLEPLVWDGKTLVSMSDIWNVVQEIAGLEAEYMAAEFLDTYGSWIERNHEAEDGRWIAMQNIGYMAGYDSSDVRQLVYKVFDVQHPVFGRTEPTNEEAFQMGRDWGVAIKEGRPFP